MNYIKNNIFITINDQMIDCAEKNDTTYTICYRVKETLLTRYQTLRTFYFEGYLVLHVAGLSN